MMDIRQAFQNIAAAMNTAIIGLEKVADGHGLGGQKVTELWWLWSARRRTGCHVAA
jgi:hypothetical protein